MTSESRFSDFFTYWGAHYKICPVEIREVWSKIIEMPGEPQRLRTLIQKHCPLVSVEIVPISTCNRFDVCVFGSASEVSLTEAIVEFTLTAFDRYPDLASSELKRQLSNPEKLRGYLRFAFDEDALGMLFRVSASLDSLVVGEPHILGQLKTSYSQAIEQQLCAGEASVIFNRCFQVAKKIRTETSLGRNGVSIGHAAVEVSKRIYQDLSHAKALVIGAGEMARIVAQHFRACNVGALTIANRTLARAEMLADEVGNCEFLEMSDALDMLAAFDVIVTATASQTYLITPSLVRPFQKRRDGRPGVIVDISVPRNVDPNVGSVDNLFVFDVDDLDKIMESNREARKSAMAQAEIIIQAEVHHFLHQRKQRENLTNVGRFHSLVKTVVEGEIRKSLKQQAQQWSAETDVVADAVAKKLVSHAAYLARTDVRFQGMDTVGDMLDFLFKLPIANTPDEVSSASDDTDNVIVLRNKNS